MDTVNGMIAWSTKKPPCGGGVLGTLCRNWRTWMGHSLVADIVTSVAMIPMLFTGSSWAVIVGIVGWLGVNLYYANREFGRNGNFYEGTDPRVVGLSRNDKKTDSVLDLMAPLFSSSLLKFTLGPVIMITVTVLQAAVTYAVYRYET